MLVIQTRIIQIEAEISLLKSGKNNPVSKLRINSLYDIRRRLKFWQASFGDEFML